MRNKKTKPDWLAPLILMLNAYAIVLINIFVFDFAKPHFNNLVLFFLLFFSALIYTSREKFISKSRNWISILVCYYMMNAALFPILSFFLMIGVLYFIADAELEKYKEEVQKNLGV